MADYYSADISFPEKYNTKSLEEMIKRDMEDEEGMEVSTEDGIINYSGMARYSEFETAENFMRHHKIPFTRFVDTDHEGDAYYIHYRPGYEDRQIVTNDKGEYIIPAKDIREVVNDLLDDKLSYADTVERLTKLLEVNTDGKLPSLKSYIKKQEAS